MFRMLAQLSESGSSLRFTAGWDDAQGLAWSPSGSWCYCDHCLWRPHRARPGKAGRSVNCPPTHTPHSSGARTGPCSKAACSFPLAITSEINPVRVRKGKNLLRKRSWRLVLQTVEGDWLSGGLCLITAVKSLQDIPELRKSRKHWILQWSRWWMC